jgi:hypothetical protein
MVRISFLWSKKNVFIEIGGFTSHP